MTVYNEILAHYDNNQTRNHYNNTVAAMSDSEGVESYDDAVKNIASAVHENNGNLDDAIAMYDSMIASLQDYIN
jgi:hypothetical protein